MQVERNALVACLPDPSGNPRPNRTIRLLHKEGYRVHSLSPIPKVGVSELYSTFEIKGSGVSMPFKIARKLLYYLVYVCGVLKADTKIFERIFAIIYGLGFHKKEIRSKNFDLILVEDLNLLPFAFDLKGRTTKVFFDAREYYPKEFEGSFYFRNFVAPYTIHLCRQFLPQLDGFYTVSNGLSDLYFEEFGIRPEVIRSTPDYQEADYVPLEKFPIKMVHHGVANRDRVLENMIEIVKRLKGKFTLDFYLTGDENYINELKQLAGSDGSISFLDPVPFKQIGRMLTQYDVGFYFLVPTGFNTTYNLPNKFFEFIQAKIGMIIGPSPEMANLAGVYGVALVSPKFTIDSMVSVLEEADLQAFNTLRFNCQNAAKELCWESESSKLVGMLREHNYVVNI